MNIVKNNCCLKPAPILPAIFDNIMSYEEQIGVLCQNFNDLSNWVTESIDELNKNLEDIVNNRFDILASGLRQEMSDLTAKVDKLSTNFLELSKKFEDFKDELRAEIDENNREISNYVQQQITSLRREVQLSQQALRQDLYNLVNDTKEYNKDYTDSQVYDAFTDLDAKVKDLQKQIDTLAFGKITLFNWFKQTTTTLQVLMDDIWRYMRGCALDTREYDTLNLTVKQMEDLELPAYQVDTQSWRRYYFDLVFVPMIKELITSKNSMRDPYTGELLPTSAVVQKVFDSINFNGKTLVEYDDLGVTAGEFDSSLFNAWQQDTDKNWDYVSIDTKNKFLPFRTLVWENPDQTKSPEGWVDVDLSNYDTMQIEVGYNNYLSYPLTLNRPVNGYIYDGSGNVNTVRGFTVRPDLKAILFNAGDNKPIPFRIYGVSHGELV